MLTRTFAERKWTSILVSLIVLAGCVGQASAYRLASGKPGENLIRSVGGFENLNDWGGSYLGMGLSQKGAFEGRSCLRVSADGTSHKAHCFLRKNRLPVTFVPGRTYELSVMSRTTGQAKAQMTMYMFDKSGRMYRQMHSTQSSSKNWVKNKITFVSIENLHQIGVILRIRNKGEVFYDKLQLTYEAPTPHIRCEYSDGKLSLKSKFDRSILSEAKTRDLVAHVTLLSPLKQKKLLTAELPFDAKDKLLLDGSLDVSQWELSVYRLVVEIRNQDKCLNRMEFSFLPGLDDAHEEMKACRKVVNNEVGVDIKEAEKFVPSAGQKIAMFTRGEPRWIQPDSLPLKDELVTRLNRVAAPGDYVFLTVAGLAVEDLEDVQVSLIGDGGSQAISSLPDVKLSTLRYWPQKTLFFFRGEQPRYWIVPELIEPMAKHSLPKGRVQQYSLGMRIPEDARGEYKGALVVSSKGQELAKVDVAVDVLPVKLTQPKDTVFGLYVDPVRWCIDKKWYNDENLLNELKEVKDHGFNSLFLAASPPAIGLHPKNGKLRVDWRELERHLRLAREAGFTDHPYIIVPYALERCIMGRTGLPKPKGRTYTKEFGSLVDQFFKQLHEVVVREGWPEPLIHGVDEAAHGEKLDHSIRVLTAARKHGFRISATTYSYVMAGVPEFAELVDFPMFACIGFWDFRTEANVKNLHDISKRTNSTLWYYGPGCYANANPPGPEFRLCRQEGALTENRYLNGVFLYRTGSKASWSWTFCRVRGDMENDFDGSGCEPKEQCIVYPGKDGKGIRDTLQWEALRQGWQDYRAVATLDSLLAQHSDSEYSGAIREELNQRIAEIPLQNYTQYPDEKLQLLRQWVLKQIAILQ